MKDNPESRFLKEELSRLTRQSGHEDILDVIWVPRIDSAKEGEVVGSTVFVYSPDPVQAIKTLRHEFMDYLVCKAVEPYQDMVNALLSILSEKAYRKKEEVVESILKILEAPLSHKDLAVL